MKFFRFLTTLIIIQLITHGTQVSTQDIQEPTQDIQEPTQDIQEPTQDIQEPTQDITDFEIRKSSPSIPFLPAAAITPLDDHGHVLPSNQCKQYIDAFSQSRRCGFSAGLETESFMGEIYARNLQIKNVIDLSPLTVQYGESVRHLEFAESPDRLGSNPQTFLQQGSADPSEKPRTIIRPVFDDAPSIEKASNQAGAEYGYFLDKFYSKDEHPEVQIGIKPVIGQALGLFPVLPDVSEVNVTFTEFWKAKVLSHRLVIEPIEFTASLWAELECQLCAMAAFDLVYETQLAIESVKDRIHREQELANLRQKMVMLNGIACITKMMGESLIDISDSIARIGTKKVETNFRGSVSPWER